MTIVATVVPSMRKTGNPFYGRVTKTSTVNGMIGFKYENSVNNQRKRENIGKEFVAEPRKWGVRIAGTPIVEHKGQSYLEVKVQRVFDTVYCVDNRLACDEEIKAIKGFFPTNKDNRQEVEKPVILRDYCLDSINEIRIAGKWYTIVGKIQAAA